MVDQHKPTDPAPQPASLSAQQAAQPRQDQDTPNKHVKVRAKVQRGIIRAGIHWPAADTYEVVSATQLEQLKNEPLLEVKEISESEVPADKKRTPAEPLSREQEAARQAELLKSAEFPGRSQGAGGQVQRGPAPPTTSVPLEPAIPPPASGIASAPNDDAAGSDKVSASGFAEDSSSRRRR